MPEYNENCPSDKNIAAALDILLNEYLFSIFKKVDIENHLNVLTKEYKQYPNRYLFKQIGKCNDLILDYMYHINDIREEFNHIRQIKKL